MEYIILDLEWDSTYYKPEQRFVNQILQIGAVRLDEDFNTIAEFSEIIRSEISSKVSGRFSRLTGITSEKMRQGLPFAEAVKKYNKFAEGALVTMSFSNSDLYTIMENEEHILKNKERFSMNYYLDLQMLIQAKLKDRGYESQNQISLEGAAELLGFNTEGYELHTALDDCRVCALMLKECYEKERFNSLLRDTKKPDFYARLKFRAYPISDINDSNINKNELKFSCPNCGGNTKRLSAWKYRNRWFVTDFECEKCAFRFNGRVAFKKTYDDLQVRHRVCEYKPRKKENNDMQALSEKV